MISLKCPWLIRMRRRRPTVCPIAEALETRTAPAVSVTASIGGLALPVISVTLPQPGSSVLQKVSLIVKSSSVDQQLHQEAALGKSVHDVTITLSDGTDGKDTIQLTNTFITSYRLIPGPAEDLPEVVLAFEGLTGRTGSITANVDDVMTPVISLSIPRAPNDEAAQPISLVVKLSPGLAKLSQDAENGKVIPEVEIALDDIGNDSTYSLDLSRVLISSIQYMGTGESPEAAITLVSR